MNGRRKAAHFCAEMDRFEKERDSMEQIEVFCGNFGSGKTELSLAHALQLHKEGEHVTLIDLDLVNPYFTSGQRAELLRAQGIEVFAPQFVGSGVDTPTMPAALAELMAPKGRVVVDLGGDPIGAVVLGSLAPQLAGRQMQVYFVCNAFRPFTSTVEDAKKMLCEIQNKCRMPITGIINNANLADETTVETLLIGEKLVCELSQETGIAVIGYGVSKPLLPQAQTAGLSGRAFVLDRRRNRPQWERNED